MTAKRDQAASDAARRRAELPPLDLEALNIGTGFETPAHRPADEEQLPSLFDGEPTDGPGWPD
jgi:hypothetical protein